MKKYTDHDIKEAVFYSQAKPELLIGILTDIINNASTGADNSQLENKVTTLEGKVTTLEDTTVPNLSKKVTDVEGKVSTLKDTTVPGIDSKVSTLEGKVTALEEKVATNHPE